MEINAFVEEIGAYRMGHNSEKFAVTASYENAGIVNSIKFEAPISEATKYYIGQIIIIKIEPLQCR